MRQPIKIMCFSLKRCFFLKDSQTYSSKTIFKETRVMYFQCGLKCDSLVIITLSKSIGIVNRSEVVCTTDLLLLNECKVSFKIDLFCQRSTRFASNHLLGTYMQQVFNIYLNPIITLKIYFNVLLIFVLCNYVLPFLSCSVQNRGQSHLGDFVERNMGKQQ